MTLKDFLRIFRRRILWFVVAFLFGLVLYGGALVTEKKQFIATAKVIIDTPREIALISQIPQRLYVSPTNVATWQSIISGRKVIDGAYERLRITNPNNIDRSLLSGITVSSEPQTFILRISATAFDINTAVAVANAVTEYSQEYSKSEATKHLTVAINKIEEQVNENTANLKKLEEGRDNIVRDIGAVNISKKVDGLYDSLGEVNRKVKELNEKMVRNRQLLEKISNDRAVSSHLSIGTTPNTVMRFEYSPPDSPVIEHLENKILALRLEYNNIVKKYTSSNPEVKTLQKEIKSAEAQLTQAREEAIGRDLDREEIKLLNENELYTIERNSWLQSLEEVNNEYERVSKLYGEYQRLDRQYNDIYTRNSNLVNILTQLGSVKEAQTGYATVSELADQVSAIEAERKMARLGPFAILLALFIGMAAAYTAELMDTTVRTDYDVKRHLNYQLIGSIPIIAKEDVLMAKSKEPTVLSEIFDTMATMVHSAGLERPIKTILIASANPREGKTSFAINIATAISKQVRKVLLIDGDMRVPTIHTQFGLDNMAGFSELLASFSETFTKEEHYTEEKIDDATTALLPLVIKDVGLEGLSVVTSGSIHGNPYALLTQYKLSTLFNSFKRSYEYIIIDSPPLLRAGDAIKVAGIVDAVIFIVEAGKTDQKEATWAKHLLENVGAKIVGVVLNKATTGGEQYYYYYNYKDKYYRRGN